MMAKQGKWRWNEIEMEIWMGWGKQIEKEMDLGGVGEGFPA